MLDNDYAILFIRGEQPMMDRKYNIRRHPNVKLAADGKATPYVHGGAPNASASIAIQGTPVIKEATSEQPEAALFYTVLSGSELEAELDKEESI